MPIEMLATDAGPAQLQDTPYAMTKSDKDDATGSPRPESKPDMKRDNTGKWVAGVGMGIGSAALVAALLYANRGKPDAKKKKRPAPEPTD